MSAKLDLISTKVDANSKNISEIRQSRPIENASANSLNEAVSVTLNEISEQERRKSNLCVFGLTQVDGTNDADLFFDVCESNLNISRNDMTDQIENITRIGKPHTNRPRPCIIRFRSFNLRNKILRAAPNLKNFNELNRPLRPIIITPDLTKLQQEERSKLNAELKRRRQQDEDVIVRGGRIIPRPAVTHGGQGNRNLAADAPPVNVISA